MVDFCGCVCNKEGDLGMRLCEIWDELVELSEAKDWEEFKDEWSDVVFGVGRLLGYFWGVKYVSLWGDDRHIKKIKARMLEYGCVRSKRHLLNGKCCIN
jgi:hypothetical protein